MKIIPAIDIMDGNVVRLIKGEPKNKITYSSDPINIAKKWEKEGADMLHVVDLDATLELGSNFDIIKKIIENVSIPVEIAGGLRTKDSVEKALQHASKVVLGTIAYKNKQILEEIAQQFGKERIVISADQQNGYIVISGWKETTGTELIDGIKDFTRLGYFEFLITSVDRDGTLTGPDLDTLRKTCSLPTTKIIASGGISNMNDVVNVKKSGASGVILGKALYDEKISLQEVKSIV